MEIVPPCLSPNSPVTSLVTQSKTQSLALAHISCTPTRAHTCAFLPLASRASTCLHPAPPRPCSRPRRLPGCLGPSHLLPLFGWLAPQIAALLAPLTPSGFRAHAVSSEGHITQHVKHRCALAARLCHHALLLFFFLAFLYCPGLAFLPSRMYSPYEQGLDLFRSACRPRSLRQRQPYGRHAASVCSMSLHYSNPHSPDFGLQ